MTPVSRTAPLNHPEDLQDFGDTEFRFGLNPAPSPEWVGQFNTHYNISKPSDYKPAGIVGNTLRIDCHHSQLKHIYLPRIDAAIAAANQLEGELVALFNADQARKRAAEEAELARKQAILDNLK